MLDWLKLNNPLKIIKEKLSSLYMYIKKPISVPPSSMPEPNNNTLATTENATPLTTLDQTLFETATLYEIYGTLKTIDYLRTDFQPSDIKVLLVNARSRLEDPIFKESNNPSLQDFRERLNGGINNLLETLPTTTTPWVNTNAQAKGLRNTKELYILKGIVEGLGFSHIYKDNGSQKRLLESLIHNLENRKLKQENDDEFQNLRLRLILNLRQKLIDLDNPNKELDLLGNLKPEVQLREDVVRVIFEPAITPLKKEYHQPRTTSEKSTYIEREFLQGNNVGKKSTKNTQNSY